MTFTAPARAGLARDLGLANGLWCGVLVCGQRRGWGLLSLPKGSKHLPRRCKLGWFWGLNPFSGGTKGPLEKRKHVFNFLRFSTSGKLHGNHHRTLRFLRTGEQSDGQRVQDLVALEGGDEVSRSGASTEDGQKEGLRSQGGRVFLVGGFVYQGPPNPSKTLFLLPPNPSKTLFLVPKNPGFWR